MKLGSGLYSSDCIGAMLNTLPPRNVGSDFIRYNIFFLQNVPDHVQGPPSLLSVGTGVNAAVV